LEPEAFNLADRDCCWDDALWPPQVTAANAVREDRVPSSRRNTFPVEDLDLVQRPVPLVEDEDRAEPVREEGRPT
jgi:hypothetical protein